MGLDIKGADQLQTILEQQQSLTTVHEGWVQSEITVWAALREADSNALKAIVGWPRERDYIIDPIASKISEAFADLLFSEDPVITSAATLADEAKNKAAQPPGPKTPSAIPRNSQGEADQDAMEGPDRTPPPDLDDGTKEDDTDQEKLDAIVESNDLPSELREAEKVCSSEGEVWWRIYVDEGQSDYPIIQWYSRSHVRPFFRGRKLVACAFFEEIFREEVNDQYTVFRWVCIYSDGHVRNLLYRGTVTQLGTSVDLKQRPETEGLVPEWNHGFDMLAGRIPNRLARDRRYGVSDYKGIKDLLFSLNEATTVGHENMRLTAKKRAVVPASALQDDGRFDAGEDVLTADDDLDVELGKAASNKFAILEYSFDAQGLIAYKEDLAGIILTRVGISQQFSPVTSRAAGESGAATSGTALRVRLIPTTLASSGKARHWDDQLPKILMLSQLVDKDQFNRNWSMPGEPPAIERGQPLPQDETEKITMHSAAVTAEIESRRTAIQDMHPDWTDNEVDAELEQIVSELDMFGPVGKKPGGGGGGFGEPGLPPADNTGEVGPPGPGPGDQGVGLPGEPVGAGGGG